MTSLLSWNRYEFYLILVLFSTFIGVRSIWFGDHLNFSSDPGSFSMGALDIIQNKKLTLIGPPLSLEFEARKIFGGPYTYYVQLFFLYLGRYDPISSSYMFMLFAAAMVPFLYFGIKWILTDVLDKKKKSDVCWPAILIVTLYTLLPFYVNYTKFLWNPNYQFVFLILSVFLLGSFIKKKQLTYFLLFSFFLGITVSFHYLLVISMPFILIYLFWVKRIKKYFFLFFICGFVISFLPLIIFEFRHDFYNLRTLVLFANNWESVLGKGDKTNPLYWHYYLSLSFLVVIALVMLCKKFVKLPVVICTYFLLLIWSLYLYIPKPTHGYNMAEEWNIYRELAAHEFILDNPVDNFNVYNQVYDSLAWVQKYLLQKEGVNLVWDDYYNNEYLFIITDRENFLEDPAYEVKNVALGKVINQKDIDSKYTIYLVKKTL